MHSLLLVFDDLLAVWSRDGKESRMTPSSTTEWIMMYAKIGNMPYLQQNKLLAHLYFPRLCSFAFQDEFSCGHVGNIQEEMCGRHKAARRVVWTSVSVVAYVIEWRLRSLLRFLIGEKKAGDSPAFEGGRGK